MSVQNSSTSETSNLSAFQAKVAEAVAKFEADLMAQAVELLRTELGADLIEERIHAGRAGSKGPQHETRVMPTAADVLALAEYYGVAFVEVDGWVNALVTYPGGSTVVYKAPTDAAVS